MRSNNESLPVPRHRMDIRHIMPRMELAAIALMEKIDRWRLELSIANSAHHPPYTRVGDDVVLEHEEGFVTVTWSGIVIFKPWASAGERRRFERKSVEHECPACNGLGKLPRASKQRNRT